jgi:hypothetical protein
MNSNYDLDTKAGMENSKAWVQRTIDMLKDGGMWAIPRTLAIYSFNKKDKVVTRINNDPSTDRVLKEMGWTLN